MPETKSMIFGVRIDNAKQLSLCERIFDAKGLQNNYMIGADMAWPGENAFDKLYPWCEMKRCNITNGKVVYDSEAGFTVEKDVFVEIPQFYSCRKVEGDIEDICISGESQPGFELESCFRDAQGNELECVYVAAYMMDGNTGSVSGSVPQVQCPQSELRQRANDKGFMLMDIATWLAVRKLILIEFADKNMANHFSGYGDLTYGTAVRATASKKATNTIHCMGYEAKNLRIGQKVAVMSDETKSRHLADREITAVTRIPRGYEVTFTGEPVDAIEDVTVLYCTGQPNGQTDCMTYHTGRPGLENTLSPFRYRWMENLWGNVWTMVDGVVIKDLRYYVTTDPNKYTADLSQWTMLSYPAPEQTLYPRNPQAFINRMGYDPENSQYNFPSKLENAPFRYGDKLYTMNRVDPDGKAVEDGTEFGLVVGGGWDHRDFNGMFTMRFWSKRNVLSSWLYGTRMILRGKL